MDELEDVSEVDDPWLRIQHVNEWTGDLDGMIERGFIRLLVVIAPGQPELGSVDELSGREIHVRPSSSYYQSLRDLSKEFRAAGKPEILIRTADENLEAEALLEMVNASLLPATVIDSHKWNWIWSKIFTGLKVNPEVAVRENGEVAPTMRRNSPQLSALLDEFYQTHGVGSGFLNTVINRYFKSTKWVTNANETAERKKYVAVVDYFKKYAAEYDFDYLMLAAQGYRESRLDQNARSRAGAVGIMQLMPKTAAGSPIFIPNVEEAEDNVHAGVKYMRYIVDKYFDDPEIEDVNRLLFAFATYNTGPNRVVRLRRQASEYGFNPNEWFHNVEYLVEQKAGREPVRYVGNIDKCYVAYRRIRDIEAERAASSSPAK